MLQLQPELFKPIDSVATLPSATRHRRCCPLRPQRRGRIIAKDEKCHTVDSKRELQLVNKFTINLQAVLKVTRSWLSVISVQPMSWASDVLMWGQEAHAATKSC